MIRLTHDTPIVLGVAPADFRCGIDGFVGRTRELLGRDPRDGTLYVYINRARTMIRGVVHEGNGYWLMTKRLSRGRFGGWPTGEEPMTVASARALRTLLDGGPWQASGATDTIGGATVPGPSRTPAGPPIAAVHTAPQRPWTRPASTPS